MDSENQGSNGTSYHDERMWDEMVLKQEVIDHINELMKKFGYANVIRALEDKRDGIWTVTYCPKLNAWGVATVRTQDGEYYTVQEDGNCNCKNGVKGDPCVHQVLVELEKEEFKRKDAESNYPASGVEKKLNW